jgi:hypothetical protein
VEKLPVEWELQWKEMKTSSSRDLPIKEGTQSLKLPLDWQFLHKTNHLENQRFVGVKISKWVDCEHESVDLNEAIFADRLIIALIYGE